MVMYADGREGFHYICVDNTRMSIDCGSVDCSVFARWFFSINKHQLAFITKISSSFIKKKHFLPIRNRVVTSDTK